MTQISFYPTEYRADSNGLPYHISAGGVVYKKVGYHYEFLVLGRDDNGVISYHLPKGTLHVNETLESCALREIAEESGCETKLTTYIGAKTDHYTYKDEYFDKTIHYYLTEYLGESDQMDDEHDFREWCSFDDAIARLSTNIKQENVFLERAKRYLNG